MDPNSQQNNNRADFNQSPLGQSQSAPSSGSFGGIKVIQPLSNDIKPELVVPQVPPQPLAAPSQATEAVTAQAIDPILGTATPQPTRPDPSSIYPDATRGISSNGGGYATSAPTNDAKATMNTPTFDEGYVLGTTIFFYQLIAGLVLGFVVSHFIQTFSSVSLVLAISYVIEYLILLYLPYRVLKSNAVEEPLWLTLLGTAIQTVILAIGYELTNLLLKLLESSGNTTLVFFIGIAFLIVSYSLTKLSWGTAFSAVGKINNKVAIRAIGIGLLVILVGGAIAHDFIGAHRARASNVPTTSASTPQSVGLTSYHINSNPSFSLDFYKGSKTASDGHLTYSTGHAIQGVSISIVGGATLSSITSCDPSGAASEFGFHIQGSTGIVCVSNSNTVTNYIGYIQVQGKNYVVNMFAYSYQQNLTTVKAIFNSIDID